jgi:hypothetical protein
MSDDPRAHQSPFVSRIFDREGNENQAGGCCNRHLFDQRVPFKPGFDINLQKIEIYMLLAFLVNGKMGKGL